MWALLNRKWRTVEMDEIKRMPLETLETIVGSVEWTKEETGRIWETKRQAFEVF